MEFRRKNKTQLASNPDFSASFAQIGMAFGIDPLVLTAEEDHQERENQLTLKVVEFCMNSRSLNGGVVSIDDLVISINKDTMVSDDMLVKFARDDITRVLRKLEVLGSELTLIDIGRKKYIKCTPQDLNVDQQLIIETADMLGFVSVPILRDNFKWSKYRCKSAIDELVMNGILWLDAAEPELKYWTTSWINKDL